MNSFGGPWRTQRARLGKILMFLNDKFLNSKGFNLMSIMVASGVSMTLVAVMAQQFLTLHRMQAKWNTVIAIMDYKHILRATVESELSWGHTLRDSANTYLECLRTQKDCRGAGGPLILRTTSNSVFYNSMNTDNGLTANMVNCDGFRSPTKANLGDPACPFRLNLTWEAICPLQTLANSIPCTDPFIRIRGEWSYTETGMNFMGGLNLGNYNIDFIRSRKRQIVDLVLKQMLTKAGQCSGINGVTGFKSGSWLCYHRKKNLEISPTTTGSYFHAHWYCNNMNRGGHKDWYLPNISELQSLYKNRREIGISDGSYWSTTPGPRKWVQILYFYDKDNNGEQERITAHDSYNSHPNGGEMAFAHMRHNFNALCLRDDNNPEQNCNRRGMRYDGTKCVTPVIIPLAPTQNWNSDSE